MFGEKILDYWDDILRDLKEIIAVPSVAVPQAGPYGRHRQGDGALRAL
mgnify:CR=1 FL=1